MGRGMKYVRQWFYTRVPRHTRLPWDSVTGVAGNQFYLFTFMPVLASRGATKHSYEAKRLGTTDVRRVWEFGEVEESKKQDWIISLVGLFFFSARQKSWWVRLAKYKQTNSSSSLHQCFLTGVPRYFRVQ